MSEQEETEDTETPSEAAAPTEDDSVDELEMLKAERDELATTVEALEEERDDLTTRLKRTAADFENYKKRQAKRREQLEAEATESLVGRLIDVRDNLKRAIDQETTDIDALKEGMKLTLDEFDRVLDAEGVTEISPQPGETVDPQKHEVMLQVDSDEPPGTVAEVFQAGYALGEKVLRPAQVTVSQTIDDDDDNEE